MDVSNSRIDKAEQRLSELKDQRKLPQMQHRKIRKEKRAERGREKGRDKEVRKRREADRKADGKGTLTRSPHI